jgi:hypothetical protein
MWSELESLLSAYLEGRASRHELGLWLAEFDWDSADPEAMVLQDDVATLDLILTEVTEGLRPKAELRDVVERLAHPPAAGKEGGILGSEVEARRL